MRGGDGPQHALVVSPAAKAVGETRLVLAALHLLHVRARVVVRLGRCRRLGGQRRVRGAHSTRPGGGGGMRMLAARGAHGDEGHRAA